MIAPKQEASCQQTENFTRRRRASRELKARKPKTMSLKQLEANRRNALKSTGPKTAEGKAQSSLNALKHGVLSKSVVVSGHFYTEDPLDFVTLQIELEQNLRPEGRVEQLLVERIATCAWRLRRVLKAENGEIRLSTDAGIVAHLRQRQRTGEVMARLGNPTGQWCSPAVRYHVDALKRLRERVQTDGRLTVEALSVFSVAFENREIELTDRLKRFLEADGSGENNSQHGRDVLAYLDEKIADFEEVCQHMAEEESREDLARLDAAILPSVEILDKLQRYETTLERQLYRAMNQLERLQRRRNGENVPPPFSVI